MFFQKKIGLIVSFGKSIPGFKQLCLDDQANLVKSKMMMSDILYLILYIGIKSNEVQFASWFSRHLLSYYQDAFKK